MSWRRRASYSCNFSFTTNTFTNIQWCFAKAGEREVGKSGRFLSVKARHSKYNPKISFSCEPLFGIFLPFFFRFFIFLFIQFLYFFSFFFYFIQIFSFYCIDKSIVKTCVCFARYTIFSYFFSITLKQIRNLHVRNSCASVDRSLSKENLYVRIDVPILCEMGFFLREYEFF